MDDLDRLLAAGEPPSERRQTRNRCKFCFGFWHGLPAKDGCPGAFATPEQECAYWQIVKERDARQVR